MVEQLLTCHWLTKLQYPLANKFYRAEGLRGKVRGDDQCAVLKNSRQEIVAVVCLRAIDTSRLLMGMAVAKAYQRRGFGRQLLQAIHSELDNDTYTFSYAHLIGFYTGEGFREIALNTLPDGLQRRYLSYQEQGRNIIPMQFIEE